MRRLFLLVIAVAFMAAPAIASASPASDYLAAVVRADQAARAVAARIPVHGPVTALDLVQTYAAMDRLSRVGDVYTTDIGAPMADYQYQRDATAAANWTYLWVLNRYGHAPRASIRFCLGTARAFRLKADSDL